MGDFNRAIKPVLAVEKGYVNNPNDSGGETMYGITKDVARSHGYKGAMKDLPLSLAMQIYKTDYWDTLKLDLIKSQVVSEIIFDISVNGGQGKAAEFLQRTINFMTKSNIDVDRAIGVETIKKANEILTDSQKEKAVRILSALAGAHYLKCCELFEKNEEFLLGWLRRADEYLKRVMT